MADLRILITGELNPTATEKAINDQLKEIGKRLNVNIGINGNELDKLAKQVSDLQSKLKKSETNLVGEKDLKKVSQLESDFDKVLNKYRQIGEVSFTKTFDPLTNQLERFNLTVNKADGTVEKLKFELAEMAGMKGLDNLFYLKDQSIIDKTASMREKQLQNEQKINDQLDKQDKKRQKELEDLQHVVEMFQKKTNINVSGLVERYGSHVNSKELKQFNEDLNNIPLDNLDAARKHMDKLSVSLKGMAMNARIASGDAIGFGEMLSTAMTRFPVTNYQAGVKLF